MARSFFLLIPALFYFTTMSSAWAHGGGLDSYGCHHNRKAGGYHCHRGPSAKEHFDSKEAMLRQSKASEAPKDKRTPAERK